MRPRQRSMPLGRARTTGPAVLTCGAAVVLAGSFLRWLRSGTVGRSSYDMLGLIERIGFAPGGVARILIALWPLMPLAVTSAVVATWWGRRVIGAAVGLVAGIYAGAFGTVVAVAGPTSGPVTVTGAPAVTAVGAAVLVLGSIITLTVRVPSAHVR